MSGIQKVIHSIEEGLGRFIINLGVACCLALGTAWFYTHTQFKGFTEAEAMDHAQVARNITRGEGMTTRLVRPADLRHLAAYKEISPDQIATNGMLNAFPDLLHAPGFPYASATVLKVFPADFDSRPDEGGYPAEARIVWLNIAFLLISAVLVFFLGMILFSPLCGILATTLFVVVESLWSSAISGSSDMMLLCCTALASVGAALVATRSEPKILQAATPDAEPIEIHRSPVLGFILLTLGCIAMVHVRYAAWLFVPGLLVAVGLGGGRKSWVFAVLTAVLTLAASAPWVMRNMEVAGTPFGLAPFTALEETISFPEDRFMRSPVARTPRDKVAFEVKWKMKEKLPDRVGSVLGRIGMTGFAAGLFFAAMFFPFGAPWARSFRWGVLVSLFLLIPASAIFGEPVERLVVLLFPVMIVYGAAFYFLLIQRLELPTRGSRIAIGAVLVIATAAPLILRLLPPNPYPPYPTYYPPLVASMMHQLEPEEWVATDTPWATAWYADQPSVWIPNSVDPLKQEVMQAIPDLAALYFTPETFNQPFYKSLINVHHGSWYSVLVGDIVLDPFIYSVAQPFGFDELAFFCREPRAVRPRSSGAAAVTQPAEAAVPVEAAAPVEAAVPTEILVPVPAPEPVSP